jgi:DNA polymerase
MKPEPTRLLFMDYETFYDSAAGYTLKKLTPVEYILHEKYETILLAVQEGINGKGYVVDGPDVPRWVKDAEPTRALTATVSWNSLFDACISAWRYGYVPGRLLDAMTMTKAIIGHELKSVALANVARHFNLPPKGDMVQRVDGMHRQDIIDKGMWPQECDYAMHDNKLCSIIWQILEPNFPWAEQRLQDLVIRCAAQPQMLLDKHRLFNYYKATKAQKENLLTQAGGIDKAALMSANKFAEMLESHGVDVQRKVTKAASAKHEAAIQAWWYALLDGGNVDKGPPPEPVTVPALAKTDTFMQGLLYHEDSEVAALAAARLGHKSTIEETRAKRLLQISMLDWAIVDGVRVSGPNMPWMPVPLRYAGAHTHRLSGDWSLNEQNMKRKSELRYAHVAPKDHSVIVADLGQIECRLNGWICGQTSLVDTFRRYDNGDKSADPYNLLGTAIFGRPINRKLDADFIEGFIGKTGTLGLGYGCGEDRFYGMVLELSYIMGIKLGDRWTRELASKSVGVYRDMNQRIVDTWYKLSTVVYRYWLHGGVGQDFKFGPVTICKGRVVGPNGLEMRYHSPFQTTDGTGRAEYWYHYADTSRKMYGAKLLENIVQFLARIVVMNAALRLNDRGYRFCLQAHDELVFVVPNEGVDKAKKIIYEEFVRPPSWARDLPLAADVGVGHSYGAAK